MDKIRPFSEGISTGSEKISFSLNNPESLFSDFRIKTPEEALNLMKKALQEPQQADLLRGTYRIPAQVEIDQARKILSKHLKELQTKPTEYWMKTKKWGPLRVALQKRTVANALQFTGYSKAMKEGIAKVIINRAAKTATNQAGFKTISKTILKKAARWIPGVIAGMTLGEVIRKISAIIKESDNKSESNAIPYGENYHRDVGWY